MKVDELSVNFTMYKHKKTGAELMSVEADDDNKVFGVAFRTRSGSFTTETSGPSGAFGHELLERLFESPIRCSVQQEMLTFRVPGKRGQRPAYAWCRIAPSQRQATLSSIIANMRGGRACTMA